MGREGAGDAIDVIDCPSRLVLANGTAKSAESPVDAVTLRIPVGSRHDLDVVELSTTVVVLGLLVYLLWTFWNTARRITRAHDTKKDE